MGKNGTFLVCHDDDGPPRLRKSFIAFSKKKYFPKEVIATANSNAITTI